MLFMMVFSVSSNFNCFWRGSMFKIFFRGEDLEKRTKTRLYFRALFVHCDAAPQKVSGTFDDFFNSFFFMAAVCSGTMYT